MKRAFFYFIIIFLSIFFVQFVLAEESQKFIEKIEKLNKSAKPGKQYLILIAIDKYANRLPLKNHVNNAEQLKKIIVTKYYIDKVIELYDFYATKGNIDRLFKKLQIDLKKNDSLLIFYSGHGYIDKSSNIGYWIPFDAGINEDVKENWLSNDYINKYLSKIASNHICLISDSCFSSDVIEPVEIITIKNNIEYFKEAYSKKSRDVLTSGIFETSSEQSEFVSQLKAALKKNKSPYLDTLMLYNKIEPKMTESMPLFGDLKDTGYQEGANFLLFLREKDPIKPDDIEKIVKENEVLVEAEKETTVEKKGIKLVRKLTDKEIKHKYFKIIFSPKKVNKAAITLLPIGSTIATIGLGLFIFDAAAYFPYLLEMRNGTSYDQYDSAYQNNIILFANGILFTALGLSVMVVSLSLRLYVVKQKKLSLNIDVDKDIRVSFSYRFNKFL